MIETVSAIKVTNFYNVSKVEINNANSIHISCKHVDYLPKTFIIFLYCGQINLIDCNSFLAWVSSLLTGRSTAKKDRVSGTAPSTWNVYQMCSAPTYWLRVQFAVVPRLAFFLSNFALETVLKTFVRTMCIKELIILLID